MSSYSKGLEVSDLVTFNHKIFKNQFSGPRTALVLSKRYLFENSTQYGIRKFFDYKMLDIKSNKVYNIKTKDISVVKVLKSKKEGK